MSIDTPIQYLKGIGPKRAELFCKLGINTCLDLLEYYPRNFEDWTNITPISSLNFDETFVIKATIASSVRETRLKGGATIYKATVSDDSGAIVITFFNNKFIPKMLISDKEYFFRGKLSKTSNAKEMLSPEFSSSDNAPQLKAIYNLTAGITSNQISSAIKTCLLSIVKIDETLSLEIREKYNLCELEYAINKIHFPKNHKELETAKKRLIFEEFLVLQLGMRKIKDKKKTYTSHIIKNNYTSEYEDLLPFTLTNAQKNAISKCMNLMNKHEPMNVLLQGDVGSGKTAVAAAVAHSLVKNNFQCAMMAPTEILANQHYKSLSELLSPTNIKTALLTGSLTPKSKKELHKKIADGEIDFVVGTHALISTAVEFKNLGLVITDEQHRFGVEQRNALSKKAQSPHNLFMSATPIPRTLALMIYGDLDILILDELPKGRQKIETYAITSKLRPRAFAYINKHLEEGRQAYIVCPLIEQGESEKASIEAYYGILKKYFKEEIIAVLHGKMKASEKDAIMQNFIENKTKILLSTTVIEVGVDVPNAVIMLIENAEMYGLSQLHQLRGRVGRGIHKSTCILLTDAQNEDAISRMKLLCCSSDGFRIADEDLKMRGPGDFFGKKQHGLPELKIADMSNDIDILRDAQTCCLEITSTDKELENYKHLKAKVNYLFKSSGNENIIL